MVPEATGRPGYHPGLLLKIYVYGYIDQVASSRRLEAQRNVELMWLTGRLSPDFKTIADFRKDNGPAIRATCRRFVDLCRRLELFTHALAAIDGSKFKAVNARDKNYTRAKKRMDQVEASIARYMAAMETADRQEGELAQAKSGRLKDKIAQLREQMAAIRALAPVVEAAPDQQLSLIDPDARSMATSGNGTGVVGYNSRRPSTRQASPDRGARGHQCRQRPGPAREDGRRRQGCDGRGYPRGAGRPRYVSGQEVLACEPLGVAPLVPKPPRRALRKPSDQVLTQSGPLADCRRSSRPMGGAMRRFQGRVTVCGSHGRPRGEFYGGPASISSRGGVAMRGPSVKERSRSSGIANSVGAFALAFLIVACQPADTSWVKPASVAAHQAADQFTALAKGSDATGQPPRQTDTTVAPLLDAVFNTAVLTGKPTPPMADLDVMNDWMLSIVRVGQVYLFAGTGTNDPAKATTPAVEAKAESNVVTYAPEVGRYVDAELTAMNTVDSIVSADLAADQGKANDPTSADWLAKVRAGTTTAVDSILGTMTINGLTDNWRRARMPAILAIAPEAAKLLPADDRAKLNNTALAVAAAMDDAGLKSQLTTFASSIAAPH